MQRPLDRGGGESTTPIDRHLRPCGVKQRGQRQAQQSRLQIPKRRVDGSDRHRRHAAEVAEGSGYAQVEVTDIASQRGDVREDGADDGAAGRVAEGVA